MSLFIRLLFLIGLFAGLTSVVLADTFTFTTITYPGAAATIATGINNAGRIVGYYVDGSGVYHGFVDSGGAFTSVDDPSAPASYQQGTFITGINNVGQIVGYYGPTAGNGLDTAFVYSGGVFNAVGNSVVTGINDAGVIVGEDFVDNGGAVTPVSDPSATGVTVPQGINNTGVVVGYYESGGFTGVFVDNNGTFTAIDAAGLGPGEGVIPWGINDAGEIVGTKGNLESWVDNGGSFTVLFAPSTGSANSTAYGINDSGQVVGYFIDGSGTQQGFLATPTSSSPEPSTLVMALASFLGIAGYLLCSKSRLS